MDPTRCIYWEIIQATHSRMVNEIAWPKKTGDSVYPIKANAIVIRESVLKEWDNQMMQKEVGPGIIITLPKSSPDAIGGEASTDDILYQMLIQLIWKDGTVNNNLHTKLFWLQQIRRAFHSQRIAAVPEVNRVTVSSVDVIDERRWTRHAYMIGSLMINAEAREHRVFQTV